VSCADRRPSGAAQGTATSADAPGSPRRTAVLVAMTADVRVAAPNRGEKAAPNPAPRDGGLQTHPTLERAL